MHARSLSLSLLDYQYNTYVFIMSVNHIIMIMGLWDINSVYLDILSKCQTTLSRTWPPISQASSTPKASTSQMIRVRKPYPFSSINGYCRFSFTILQILILDTADSYSRSAPSLSSSVYCITLCSFACHYSIIIRKSVKRGVIWGHCLTA